MENRFIVIGVFVLALTMLYGCLASGTIFNAFTPYFGFDFQDEGVWLVAESTVDRTPPFYTYVGFNVYDEDLNGESLTLATTTYDTGNGVCGVHGCGDGERYFAILSDSCPSIDSLKIIDFPPGAYGTITWSMDTLRGETNTLSNLETIEYAWCNDAPNQQGTKATLTRSYTFTNDPPDCGDGTCSYGETESTCPEDCGCDYDGICESERGETSTSCSDCATVYCDHDGVCEPSQGETITTCPSDCDQASNYCSDNTPYGECSETTLGFKCVDGELVEDSSCEKDDQDDILDYWGWIVGIIIGVAVLIYWKG